MKICKHPTYACIYDDKGTCVWASPPGSGADCTHDAAARIEAAAPNWQSALSTTFDLITAPEILSRASECIGNRAVERDQPTGERSMARCVSAYNALTGQSMTELQGWLFMATLKMARSQGGRHQIDDYIDGAAYMALAGEAAK